LPCAALTGLSNSNACPTKHVCSLNSLTKGEGIVFGWHLKSAEEGYAPAQKDVGMSYANGDGVAEDDKKAFKWLIKSAKQGYELPISRLTKLDFFE
jgi:TPR repeat protein